jgi:hypothetical protein
MFQIIQPYAFWTIVHVGRENQMPDSYQLVSVEADPEQQVQRKVSRTYLQGIFRAGEAEIAAPLNQKLLQLVQESTMQVGLHMGLRQTEEFRCICISKTFRASGYICATTGVTLGGLSTARSNMR